VIGAWTGFIWLRIGIGGGICKCYTEPSGSIKFGGILDLLKTIYLLWKESDPWS